MPVRPWIVRRRESQRAFSTDLTSQRQTELSSPCEATVRTKTPQEEKRIVVSKRSFTSEEEEEAVPQWMRLIMELLMVGEWVPHGGLPTCITVPKDLRPRNNQECEATTSRNRISRKSEPI